MAFAVIVLDMIRKVSLNIEIKKCVKNGIKYLKIFYYVHLIFTIILKL